MSEYAGNCIKKHHTSELPFKTAKSRQTYVPAIFFFTIGLIFA